jgi:hypothetical protein
MNNTERLIGKMNDELAAFVAGLERLPVQDVIEKAGEIAVKTDMALLLLFKKNEKSFQKE